MVENLDESDQFTLGRDFIATTVKSKKNTQKIRVRISGKSLEKYESKIAIRNFTGIVPHG